MARTWLVAAAVMALVLGSGEAVAAVRAKAFVNAANGGPTIAPEIYGQFAEQLGSGITGGIWVGEGSPIPNVRGYRSDVLEALKALKVPVVRWPGGCYADIYHWRDGIGPRARRPVTLNSSWGNVEERNQFGTHEFFDFAELIGAKAYLNINVGTGTPQEARDWVEYVTSGSRSRLAEERRANGREQPWKLDYIGIGNEMWGCGGSLTGEEFAPILRGYAQFLKSDAKLIAAGPAGDDYRWTEALLTKAPNFDAISLHYYTLPTGDWGKKGAAVGFDEAAWAATFARTRKLEEYIVQHDERMGRADPDKKLGLYVAEWGTWYDPAPGSNPAFLVQDNTLRDALVAATNFHIFHRNAARVRMANIAQMVNVLQAMILTDGPRMVRTPTYHAFAMYRPFQGARALPVAIRTGDAAGVPIVDVTAAKGADGTIHLGLVNVDPNARAPVELELAGVSDGRVEGQVLTAPKMDSRNRFGGAEEVRPVPFTGARWKAGKLTVTLPPKSVVVLALK